MITGLITVCTLMACDTFKKDFATERLCENEFYMVEYDLTKRDDVVHVFWTCVVPDIPA